MIGPLTVSVSYGGFHTTTTTIATLSKQHTDVTYQDRVISTRLGPFVS